MRQRARVIVVMSCRAELDGLRGRQWAKSRSAGYDTHDSSSRGASMRRRMGGPHTGTSMPGTSAPGGSLTAGPMSGTWALEDVPRPGGTGPSRVSMTGAYVGDGMPPVPAKPVNKIRRWEFVKIGE